MAFRSTEGNGGPPIITSREPVEKPVIRRGPDAWIGRDEIQVEAVHGSGEVATFTINQPPFRLTYHATAMTSTRSSDWAFTVSSDVVVTWDRLPPLKPQI